MTLTRRAFAALLAALAMLTGRRVAAAPTTPAGLEFRRVKPQRLPAVYEDWDIDPATRIITHEPTGLSFAVYRKPEKSGYGDYVARQVGGTPRTDDELAAVADMGLCWYVVFGSQMQRPRGQ